MAAVVDEMLWLARADGEPPFQRLSPRIAVGWRVLSSATVAVLPFVQHPVQEAGAGRCLRMTPIRIQRGDETRWPNVFNRSGHPIAKQPLCL
jgi:hypothetical protein